MMNKYDVDTGRRAADLFSATLFGETKQHYLYLIDPTMDHHQILRDQIFSVTVHNMIEVAAERTSRYRDLNHRLSKAEQPHPSAHYYLYILAAYAEMAEDLISHFSNDEIVFISETRHQFCHGRYSFSFKEARPIYKFQDGNFAKEKIGKDQYWELYSGTLDKYGGIGEALVNLRRRFCDIKTNYWLYGRLLLNRGELIMSDLQNWTDSDIFMGKPFDIDNIVKGASVKGAFPDAELVHPMSLMDFRIRGRFPKAPKDIVTDRIPFSALEDVVPG